MIALPKDRPLIDGENEYVTITCLKPVFKGAQHLRPDYWVAEGKLDGIVMRLTVLTEDRRMFVEAGYVPAEIFQHIETAISIDIVTMKDDKNRWRVAEIVHRDENAVVHTDVERQAAWKADVVAFGGSFTRLGATELQFSTSATWINWSVDSAGRYVRLTATERTVYEGKVQS